MRFIYDIIISLQTYFTEILAPNDNFSELKLSDDFRFTVEN